jgi:hypothetical protein
MRDVSIADPLNGVVYVERHVSDDVSEHSIVVSREPSGVPVFLLASALLCGGVGASSDAHEPRIKWCVLVACVLCAWWLLDVRRQGRAVRCERVIVMRQFGVQLQVERVNGDVERQFVPRHAIRAAVINEGFKWNRVVPYVALLPHAPQAPLLVLFRHFEPRLAFLLRTVHALEWLQ